MHSREPEKKSGLANPFIVGSPVPPTHFIGRKREVTTILGNLCGPGKGCSAIIGERRIGKTSLLHYLKNLGVTQDWKELKSDYIFIYLDCLGISPFTAAGFWQKVLHLLEPLGSTELQRQIKALKRKKRIPNVDIEQLFDEIAKVGKLVVLLLDEFDSVVDSTRPGSADFFSSLRPLFTRPLRGLALIPACRNPLHDLCPDILTPGSPFYNIFVFVYLGLFSRDEADELIARALENTGIVFDEGDHEFVFGISKGYPYWLQLACSQLFDAYRRMEYENHHFGESIDRQQVRQYVEEKFIEQARPHFEELWKIYTQEERRALVTIARRSQERGFVRKITAAREYRKLIKEFNPDLYSLRSIVVKTDSGDFDVFSPIFARWILSEGQHLE